MFKIARYSGEKRMITDRELEAAKILRENCKSHESCKTCGFLDLDDGYCRCILDSTPSHWQVEKSFVESGDDSDD